MRLLVNTSRSAVLADQVAVPAGRRGSLLGLMGRASMPPGECLVLPGTRGVQTHFMRFPVDVIFYGVDGVVLDVVHALEPWRLSRFHRSAAGAIELPAGGADGTFVGDVLRIADQHPAVLDSEASLQPLPVAAARLKHLLTWKRCATYAGIVGLLFLAAWAWSTFAGRAPLTRSGEPILGDYVAFYAAGRMVLEGHADAIFDPAAVRAAQAAATQGLVPDLYDPLRNPPFVALALAPLALLDPLASFVVWSALNLAALGGAVWLALDVIPSLRRHWRPVLIIALAFAPVYRGLIGGQNATVSLLLFVLIYRSMRVRHDGRAGFWSALGLFKPQLFLVYPVVFAASRRWRALAVFSLVGAGLAVVSLAMIGPHGLQQWFQVIVDHESGNAARNAYRMHSLKAFFDLLMPDQSMLAIGLYAIGAGVLLVLLARLWSTSTHRTQSGDLALLWAFTSVVAVLVDPHLIDYDLTVLILAALLLGVAHAHGKWWVAGFYATTLCSLLFDFRLPIGAVQIQLTVPLLIAFLIWCWRELQRAVPEFGLANAFNVRALIANSGRPLRTS